MLSILFFFACHDTNDLLPLDTATGAETALETAEETTWGELYPYPPSIFFAADLSVAVQDGVTDALHRATQSWGRYGPLEYWVMGTDTDAGLALIDEFCARRDAAGHYPLAPCLTHHTSTTQAHNLMSYLLIGQSAVENNQPMGGAGRNGNREWGIHLFASSYPFAFDRRFDGIPPEEETKTIFHEYFHAVQHAFIESTDFEEREHYLGPVWFVEGGAEYMAVYETSRLWATGELTPSGDDAPSFSTRMEWKLHAGLENLSENCPTLSLQDITYSDPCSYAAYELGAWAHAYLHSITAQNQLVDVYYPNLNELGWEGAFQEAYGRSSADFYAEFAMFLERPIEEQRAILPDL